MFGSGGFMSIDSGAQPSMSQMSNIATPQKAGRQEEKQACMPVTIRGMETALAQRADGSEDLKFYGQEPSQLIVVGTLESLVRQATSMEFTLNDSTGRIKARYYMNGSASEGDLEKLAVGQYVHAVGNLRTAQKTVYFAALCLRPIDSADAVSYHMIEVAHTALKLQKSSGALPFKDPQTPMPKDAFASARLQTPAKEVQAESTDSPPVVVASTSALPEKAAPAPDGDTFRKALVNYLRRESEGNEEGVSLQAMRAHFASVPESQIRTCLNTLVEDGEAFSTIDDEHYSLM